MSQKEKVPEFKLAKITGLEFKRFIKQSDNAPEIVCPCFEPMVYSGQQHNYKNTNYYVLSCPTCTCKTPPNSIPYVTYSHYGVSPEFMRKDHEMETVTAPSSTGDRYNVGKLEFVASPEPVLRFVERNGHIESVELTGTELVSYYKKRQLERKTKVMKPLVFEDIVHKES